jgi:hypothetical protein
MAAKPALDALRSAESRAIDRQGEVATAGRKRQSRIVRPGSGNSDNPWLRSRPLDALRRAKSRTKRLKIEVLAA